MKIAVNTDNLKFFQSLSSSTRIQIIELLMEGPKNIGELSMLLNVTSAIITRHIAQMEEAGVVKTQNLPGKRGLQKICSIANKQVLVSFEKEDSVSDCQILSIPIGQYSAYEVRPTCGLVSAKGPIGIRDDPRYFSDPSHTNAALLWFGSGWVQYRIPSYIISLPALKAIEITLEICSEAPRYNENWPSEIYFYLNDVLLGTWLCPGDFGAQRGIFTPDWWVRGKGTQHGLLKTICITDNGTMLDGVQLSNVTIDKLNIQPGRDLALKIAVPPDTQNSRGINIFGKGFGNYDQDIEIHIHKK